MKAEQDEQLLQLISDALRDGPGSQAWEQAVRVIDAGDGEELDTLYRVRQRLESGKRWRQIRPGTNFTRKVMDAVDQQSDASVRPTGPATIIAILCGLLVLVVIVALVPMLLSHGNASAPLKDEFQNVIFATPWAQSDFENSIGGDWHITGNSDNKVEASHGLRAKGADAWGIISTQSLAADATFEFGAKVVPGLNVGVFVRDSAGNNLDAEIYYGRDSGFPYRLHVVSTPSRSGFSYPDSVIEFKYDKPVSGESDLRWLIGPTTAALELNGHRIWTGPNNLSTSQPRFLGVDFQASSSREAEIKKIEVRTEN